MVTYFDRKQKQLSWREGWAPVNLHLCWDKYFGFYLRFFWLRLYWFRHGQRGFEILDRWR